MSLLGLVLFIATCTSFEIRTGTVLVTNVYNSTALVSATNVTLPTANSYFILAINSFTSLLIINTCYMGSIRDTDVTVICSRNVLSFSYLSIQKVPQIVIDAFTFYNLDRQLYHLDLSAHLNALMSSPQIYPFMTGFQQADTSALHLSVNLMPNATNSSLTIEVSWNVKILNITYLLYQQESALNLSAVFDTLADVPFNYQNTFDGQSGFISVRAKANDTINVTQTRLNSDSDQSIIKKYVLSDNLEISIIRISFRSSLTCSPLMPAFNKATFSCVRTCPNSTMLWEIGNFSYCLALFSSINKTQTVLSNTKTVLIDNLDQLQLFTKNCIMPYLDNSTWMITCTKCSPEYQLHNGTCFCPLGEYLNENNSCSKCGSDVESCVVFTAKNVSLEGSNNITRVLVKIQIVFNDGVTYLDYLQSIYFPNVTVNNNNYQPDSISWSDNYTLEMTIIVEHSSSYSLFIQSNIKILVKKKLNIFYTLLPVSINIAASVTSVTVIHSFKPIFSNSESTVPIIFLLGYFVGEKINALAIFQTSSLIYLTRFMKFNSNYSDIISLVTSIFLFSPTATLKVVGNQGYFELSPINTTQISYDAAVNNYTLGQMYFTMNFNSFLSFLITVGGLQLIVAAIMALCRCKIDHKIVNDHQNTNQPLDGFNKELKLVNGHLKKTSIQQLEYQSLYFKITRSVIDRKGYIKWKRLPTLRDDCTLRQKFLYYLTILDDKKYITFTSLLLPQLLSATFLALHQLATPLSLLTGNLMFQALYAGSVLFLIVSYPLHLLQYAPLHLLKTVNVIYKRKKYTRGSLWALFCLVYYECVFCGLAVFIGPNVFWQSILIVMFYLIKIIGLWKVCKNLELVRNFLILFYFALLAVSEFLTDEFTSIVLKQIIVSLMVGIICVQILKILRSVVIFVISLFKQKQGPSKNDKEVPKRIELQTDQKNLKKV